MNLPSGSAVPRGPDDPPDFAGALLPSFDFRHRALVGILLAIFGGMLAFRINGWSMPVWHSIIDGTAPREILWGQAREVRSDDFVLDLGEALAQRRALPAFPLVNPNIGSGQFMAAPIEVPAGIFVSLFRPFTWGFLLGPDVGLAWKWWGLELGLLYALFLVFMLVSRGAFGLSLWASLGVVFSPYFQFWSLHKAEIAIHWGGCVFAAACLLAARKRWAIWAAGAFLGWSLAAMALDQIYPPLAVTLGWLLPACGLAWILACRRLRPWAGLAGTRLAAASLALAGAAAALAFFLIRYHPFIAEVQQTVYPGRRFSPGGGMPGWGFFAHNLLAEAWDRTGPWIANICESGSFILLFPAIWILLALLVPQRRAAGDPWIAVLTLYIAGLLAYSYWGIPPWLARITLLGMATTNRTQLGIGLAGQLMLVAFAANPRLRRAPGPVTRGLVLAGWLGLQWAFAVWLGRHWPDLGTKGLLAGLAFQGLLAALFWVWDRPDWGLAVLAAVSLAYTAWFNPWVRGGADYVYHNPLSGTIRALARADRNEHPWAVFGDMRLDNLPRMLGVKALGGYEGEPDFAVWERFDPGGAYRDVYNQSGYSAFQWGEGPATFASPSPGFFVATVSPLDPAFAQLGVRYFLVCDAPEIEAFEAGGGFRRLFSYGGKAIFERR